MLVNYKRISVIIIVLSWIIIPQNIFAQSDAVDASELITADQRSEIIDKVIEIFNEYYPLPDVADQMMGYIKTRQGQSVYNSFNQLDEFTSQVTKDLRSISNDDHIRISPYEKLPDDLSVETRLGSPENNYGFQKVEILPGNIGYINLTNFNNPKTAGATAIAAMNFVAHCDALILDLRLNGGGDGGMTKFLSSYFFDKSTHLTDYYIRKDDKTEQTWTDEWVPGPRIIEAPIYIMLSSYSYSSAEALAYQLQQLGRAKIVGEKTRGGAHAVRYMSFPEFLINIKVPYEREINPYSKTNFVGGVIPNIRATSEKALFVAQIEAAKELYKTETDSTKKAKLLWTITGIKADLEPIIIDNSTLAEYQGVYKNIIISVACKKLLLQRGDADVQEMIPMGNDIFKYKDPDEEKYRIHFIRNIDGVVTGLFDFDSDGDKYPVKNREID